MGLRLRDQQQHLLAQLPAEELRPDNRREEPEAPEEKAVEHPIAASAAAGGNVTYDEMKESIKQAEELMRQSQFLSKQAMRIAAGRLRMMYVDVEVLREFKRELADFNMATGRWK